MAPISAKTRTARSAVPAPLQVTFATTMPRRMRVTPKAYRKSQGDRA
jgi:hypothetical protein